MEREDSGDSCGCKCASIPGFCFKPSDEILVGYYLRQKVEGRPLSCNRYVAEFKIYDDHLMPWEILKDDDHHWITSSSSSNKIKKTIYVFTELCKKKTRVGRKSGCGSWTGQNTRVVQNAAGDIIGYKKLLTFYRDNEKKKKKKIVDKEHGHWNMHEYSLLGIDDYVICKIMKEVEMSSPQVVPVPDVIVAKDTNPQRNVENMNVLLGDHDKQLGGGDLDDQPLNQSGADWDENGWKAELDKELGFDISDDKSDEQCFDDNGEVSDRDLNGWTTELYKQFDGAENLAQNEISDDTSADVVQKLPILAVMNEPPKVQSVLNVYVEEEAVLPVQDLPVDVIEISDYDDDDSIQELPMIGAADDDKMARNNNPDDLSDFLNYIAEMDVAVQESPFVPWEDLEQISNDFANFEQVETTVEHGLDAMQDFDTVNLGDADSIFEVQLRKRMRTDVDDFKKFSSRKKQRCSNSWLTCSKLWCLSLCYNEYITPSSTS